MNNPSTSEQNYYQEDEIDLKQLFRSLADRKWFIFGFTGFITAIAVIYAFKVTPTYESHISFLAPSETSVLEINKAKLNTHTSQTIYRTFLNNFLSKEFQRDVFINNDYISKLVVENKSDINIDEIFSGFVNSISLKEEKVNKNVEKINYEKPVNFSMLGSNSQLIANFLNQLANEADKEAVKYLLMISQHKIDIRLDEITKQKKLLLEKAKQDRLSKIKRIKIEDNQKINEVNDQINRLRSKARDDRLDEIARIEDGNLLKIQKLNDKILALRLKARDDRLDKIARIEDSNRLEIQKLNDKILALRSKARDDRLNKIQTLSDAATMASELGIIDNNFKKIGDSKYQNSTLTVAISDNQKLPKWFLYGEKALLKEIQILTERENDDAYIPDIINLKNQIFAIENDKELDALKNRKNDDIYITDMSNLKNQLSKVKSNQALKTLEFRQDDSPFIDEINKLDIETIRLESIKFNISDINTMQINQYAFSSISPIKPNKRLIVAVAFIAGFILSILLVFIMNAFRPEKES